MKRSRTYLVNFSDYIDQKKPYVFLLRTSMNFLWSYHRDIVLYDEKIGFVNRQQQIKVHFPEFLFKSQEGKNCKLWKFFWYLRLHIVLTSARVLWAEISEESNSHTSLTPSSHWILFIESKSGKQQMYS